MLLHRRSRSSGGLMITYAGITLYHRVDGLPVIVKKATMMIPTVDSDSPPLPNLPSSDARWLNSSENAAAVSVLVARSSSNDVIHDKLFIPAIASMGVLVIICVFCCYQLFMNKETVHSIGAVPTVSQGRHNEPPIHSQHAIGRQENGHGARLSRNLSKATKSPPSLSASIPGSPSVRSDTVGYHHHLQQQRLQQQRQQLEQQQQDPYQQYMMAHDHGHPWQPQQRTPHPSVAGSVMQRGEGVQPQPPGVQTHAMRTIGLNPTGDARDSSVVAQAMQPPPFANAAVQQPPMYQTPINANPTAGAGWDQHRAAQQEQQRLQQQQQQQQPNSRTSHISSAQTSSTRVTSDILSYMTPPEARRPPLHNNQSQPQNQDYFSAHPASSNTSPSQTGGSITHGMIAHSAPANYNTASRGSSSPSSPHTAHGSTTIHVQPPSYTETRSDVQGKTITTPKSEKASPSKLKA